MGLINKYHGNKAEECNFFVNVIIFQKILETTVNCKMCNVGKVRSQHITKKACFRNRVKQLFCSHTDVTSYSKLLVILYVWRLGCTPYMNLQVTWEKLLQETNAVCFHCSSWVGNIVDWRVNDFKYTVMWSQIQLVSAITDLCEEGWLAAVLVAASRTTAWWVNMCTPHFCFWNDVIQMSNFLCSFCHLHENSGYLNSG
jgi:hypothetical protein